MIQKRSKFIFVGIIAVFLAAPLFALGAVSQAGFPTRTLWFSKDPFFAGDQVLIFSAITKSGPDGLSGTVEFFDGSISIGKTNFAIATDEGAKGVSLSWKAAAGSHSISAQFVEAYTIRSGVKTALTLLPNEARTETITTIVDTDTNKNGIADTVDQANKIKEATQLASTTSAGFMGTVTNLESKASEYIPAAVTEKAAGVTAFLESAREGLSSAVQNEQAHAHDRIAVIKAHTEVPGGAGMDTYDVAEKPFRYVELFALWVVAFIAQHPIIYYVIIAYIVYRIIRGVVRMVRRKQKY